MMCWFVNRTTWYFLLSFDKLSSNFEFIFIYIKYLCRCFSCYRWLLIPVFAFSEIYGLTLMSENFSYSQTLKKLDKSTNRPLYRGTQHEMVRNLKTPSYWYLIYWIPPHLNTPTNNYRSWWFRNKNSFKFINKKNGRSTSWPWLDAYFTQSSHTRIIKHRINFYPQRIKHHRFYLLKNICCHVI